MSLYSSLCSVLVRQLAPPGLSLVSALMSLLSSLCSLFCASTAGSFIRLSCSLLSSFYQFSLFSALRLPTALVLHQVVPGGLLS
jgi:hypothetical protein